MSTFTFELSMIPELWRIFGSLFGEDSLLRMLRTVVTNGADLEFS